MSSTESDIQMAQARAATSWREDSHKDPEDLEREIDETRADVRATLGVLEQRLSAEHLLDLTIGRVREHGGAFAGNLGSAARDNPVPLLLTSIGLAWMMLSRRNGNGGARPREGVAHSAESLREGASRAASATRDQLSRARSGVDYLMHEQPLVLGAIGLAAGALIGATLPGSEAEDRMIGEARDRALRRAREVGREGYRKARERAQELAEQAKQHLSEGNGDAQSSAPKWAEGHDKAASQGRGYGQPEDASAAVERAAADRRKEAPKSKSKRSKDDPESLGDNPSDPRPVKRPSEGGVGQEHSSGGFSGENSPTSKTSPV
jgi:hypothetical protein